jgi:Zn-dependent protease with chaperone function
VRPDRSGRAPVLGLTALLGSAGMAAAGAAVGTAIGSVHHVTVGAGRLSVGGLAFSYPTLNLAAGLTLALAAAGAATIAAVARAGWRQWRAHRRFLAQVEVVGRLQGHPGVRVIAGAWPDAFCAGFLRPAVYISRGAVEALTSAQLAAVIAHEHHHRRVRDPLRFACARVLAQALFFVPVLRALRDRYADIAELRADRAAVRAAAGSRGALAAALLVFDSCAGGVSPARVDSLLGEPDAWRVSWWLMIGSVAMLAAVSVVIWRTSAAASASATFNAPLFTTAPCLSFVALALPLVWVLAARVRAVRG